MRLQNWNAEFIAKGKNTAKHDLQEIKIQFIDKCHDFLP